MLGRILAKLRAGYVAGSYSLLIVVTPSTRLADYPTAAGGALRCCYNFTTSLPFVQAKYYQIAIFKCKKMPSTNSVDRRVKYDHPLYTQRWYKRTSYKSSPYGTYPSLLTRPALTSGHSSSITLKTALSRT